MWDCQPPQSTEPLLPLTLNKEITKRQEAQTSVFCDQSMEIMKPV